jgi:ubiquinone/menaquinone biosynthesis C-methylase UbiE
MTPVWFAAAVSDWDKIFDEVYLRTWAALLDPALAPAQAEGVLSLVGLESDADLLDCPCGYGRHSIEFARFGLHVIGADRSEVLLAEAKRRVGDAEWPRWARADYRELPFEDASFDCVTNLFSSLGYWGDEGDRQALREFRRVLRPGGKLVVETMHRDALMAIYTPTTWEELPDGSLMLERRTFDHERGVNLATHEIVEPDGTRIAVPYEIRVYTATELVAMAHEAGFENVGCYGDFDEAVPVSRDRRLVLVAS